MQQLCADTRCSLKDLLEAIADKEGWRESESRIFGLSARLDDDEMLQTKIGYICIYNLELTAINYTHIGNDWYGIPYIEALFAKDLLPYALGHS